MKPFVMHTIEDVLAASNQVKVGESFEIDSVIVKKTNLHKLIEDQGIICSCCGKSALFFCSWENPDHKTEFHVLHLYFEHTSKNGWYAFMNTDHIVPRYHNGKNMMINYQVTCNICNEAKGNQVDFDSLPAEFVKKVTKNGDPLPKAKGATNPYTVEIYKGYIRWYTLIYHNKANLDSWNVHIRHTIQKELRKTSAIPFDQASFNYAYKLLVRELKMEMKGTTIVRPATVFRQANGVKPTVAKHIISTRRLSSSLSQK